MLLAFVFFPILTIAILTGYQSLQYIENEIDNQLRSSVTALSVELRFWQRRNLLALKAIATVASEDQNSDRLQLVTTALGQVTPSFLSLYTTDSEGNILTAFPSITDADKSVLSKSIVKTELFQQVKSSLSITFSDIRTDRMAAYPYIDMAAPVLKDNRFSGTVIGALDISQIKSFLIQRSKTWKVETLLLNHDKQIISSTSPSASIGQVFNSPQGGEIRAFREDQIQWLPQMKGSSIMSRWRKSYYMQQSEIDEQNPWTLVVQLSPIPYINALEKLHTYILMIVLAIILLATTVANALSRRLVRPIAKLMRLTTDLQQNLSVESDFAWESKSFAEINILGANFQIMAIALQEKFQ